MSIESEYVWQDRELRFDSSEAHLQCRAGEKVIDSINSVEDTKGNNGERGALIVTNLRIIWISQSHPKINLSVGFNTILTLNIRKAKSKLRGTTQALCVLAKFNSRFEFIFTSLVKNSPRLFSTCQAVLRAYETSKLYRDLKLRGSIVRDGDLILLPSEEIYSKVVGVWNLSSDQGNLGTFFLTNIRVVWFANLASNFNVSLPYMQVKSFRVRESKFGQTLVLETFAKSGGYVLGFRIDPIEKLEAVMKEMRSFHSLFSRSPIFGVDFTVEAEAPSLESSFRPKVEDDMSLLDDEVPPDVHAMAAYYADDGDLAATNEVIFDAGLGLAVEAMPEGVTVDSLWRVI
ncbi:unnamed protein product [Ectocarpus fasciculatus]